MTYQALEPADRLRRARALEIDYEAFLAPGERLNVRAEQSPKFIYAQLVLERADRSLRLDLEAAFTEQDVEPGGDLPAPDQALDLLMDYLKMQLYEYFRSDRTERFHADWRTYPYEDFVLRARGVQSSPRLETLANDLLQDPSLD